MIVVHWKSQLWKAGWAAKQGQATFEYLFSRWRLWRVPRNVRDPELGSRLDRLLEGTGFSEWWHEVCGSSGQKLFLLQFRNGGWDVPWEWLVGQLVLSDNRTTVSLVRTLKDATPVFQPSQFLRPLKILLLQGDDGTSINARIDLAAEASAVTDAWNGLEQAVKGRFLAPIILPADDETLVGLLNTEEPDLVWFSGHGRHKPQPGLLFANRRWIGPDKIGELLRRSKWQPRFWLLMACDTARGGRTLADLPAFVTQFVTAGALSVLAMQSPIRNVSASLLATELLGALAVGLSLETGLGRARAVLRSVISDGVHPMDWATPVIWTSTRPVEKWDWNAPDNDLVQLQSLGRQFLRSRLTNPAQLAPLSSENEIGAAQAWIAGHRTWVRADPDDPETRAKWFRVLQAVQRIGSHFVVELDCETDGIEKSLQVWAEMAHGTLLPGYAPEEIVRALLVLRSWPGSGWQALAKVNNIFLAISNPPEFGTPDWFWQPLLQTEANLRVALLSPHSPPEAIVGSWVVDKIENAMNLSAMATAIEEAPRLARALAVLREPIGYSSLRLVAADASEPRSLDQWPNWQAVLVDVPGGPLMSATARQQVLSLMTDEQRRFAHRDCAQMLSHPEIPVTVGVRRETLFHALQAEDWDPALIEAEALCVLYRRLDCPLRVIKTVESLTTHARDLGSEALLPIAWAYAQLGDATAAKFWLRQARPTSPLDQAWAQGLLAELHKSTGDRQAAAEAIDKAIAICEAAQQASDTNRREIQRRLRNYRQDRARIMHFLFYDLEGACKAYEGLIAEWVDQPEAELDLAIVRRNYAECLRALTAAASDPRILAARDELNRAESIAKRYSDSPLLSEVLYEQARMAEADGRHADARDLLGRCVQAALLSGHYQVLAIAQARVFWNHEPFSYDRWHQIDADLALFPDHGWPVRTLLNGRLRAARQLEAKGKTLTALEILNGAQAIVVKHSAFGGRSDHFRIAAIAAGRELMNRQLAQTTSSWQHFRDGYDWASDFLASDGIETPEQVWARVS